MLTFIHCRNFVIDKFFLKANRETFDTEKNVEKKQPTIKFLNQHLGFR